MPPPPGSGFDVIPMEVVCERDKETKYADEWLNPRDAHQGFRDSRYDSFGLGSRVDSFGLERSDSMERAPPPEVIKITKVMSSSTAAAGPLHSTVSLRRVFSAETQEDSVRKFPTLNSFPSIRRATSVSSTNALMGGRTNLRVRFKMDTDQKPPSVLFSPHDPFVIWWKKIEVIFLSISFFRLPMVMAFGAEYLIWDIFPETYFVFDHILALNTGFYQKEGLVMDRKAIVARWFDPKHFKTGDRRSVFVAMMEFLPFYTCLAIMHFIEMPFWVLSLCGLPRCRRIHDLLNFFYQRERDLTKDVRWTALFKYALALLGSGHWFACLWWLLARVSSFSTSSWLMQYLTTVKRAMHDGFEGSLYSYSISLLWGYSTFSREPLIDGQKPYGVSVPKIMCLTSLLFSFPDDYFQTLSGVGYLGYLPTTSLESMFFVGMTLLSVLVHSFLFGILLHYIVRKDLAQEKYKSLMDQVEKYASMYSLPRKLEDAMKLFYTFQYKKKVGADEEVMKSIPTPLKMKIMVHQYHVVASDKIFTGCQEQFVSTVLSLLKPKILTPGTQIYRKNDVSREMCFIERGEVEVYDDDDVLVTTLKAAEEAFPAAGEISFFLAIPQVYTVVASKTSEVKLLTLSKEDYEEVKDRFPDARDLLINNVRALVFLGKDGDDLEHPIHDDSTDSTAQELRKRVKDALMTKLDDDVATMFNAIRDGYYDEVKLLLSKGFNPNATDYDKRTSLHFAAVAGDDKMVEMLLQHGADIHVRDRWGRNAFQDAVDNNHKKVIQQLAAHGAELELENAAGRLCSAAFADNLFELQHLVENGIDANSGDYDKRTALHLSACEGNSKIVEFLLLPMSKGDPNVTDRWGVSPLLDAIRHGNQAVARILYENGARLSIERAATFLCMAAAEGDSPMLSLLSECGVNTNIGDYDNRYPIHLAAAEGEVVSVHFLAYAHANISVKDRWGRTPLDDAITGKYWMCAKLLLGFGAQLTIDITEEAMIGIAAASTEGIRELVRAEKDLQRKRKDTEKQLRDNVKWLISDSDTWVKSLNERMEQVGRVMEKYMNGMEDEDQLGKEAGQFLDICDHEILVCERPKQSELALGQKGSDYLLSRYFKDTRAPSSHAHGQPRMLKSMAHFFFKLLFIEKVLQGFKRRVKEASRLPVLAPSINATTLGEVLLSYGIHSSPEDLRHYVDCCTLKQGHGNQPTTDLLGLEEEGEQQPPDTHVTFDDLLTSIPFWKSIGAFQVLDTPVSKELKDLQEAVQCVFEGFDLLDADGNGRMTRTEWRLQKRQGDLGDFAVAIDRFMEEHDVMALDSFFQVVAYWSGEEEVDAEGEGCSDSGEATGSTPPSLSGDVPAVHLDSNRSEEVKDYYAEAQSVRSRLTAHSVRSKLDASHHTAELRAIVSMDGSAHYYDIADQPNGRFQDISYFKRFQLYIRFKAAERRLSRQVDRDVTASVDDVRNRFDRLDIRGRGVLDETRTQLLLSWAFDVDLKAEEWDAIFYHLAGEDSCLVRRKTVVDWTESLVKQQSPREASPVATCAHTVASRLKTFTSQLNSSSFVIDHESRFNRCCEVLRAITAVYMFLTVPYQIAFLHNDLLGLYYPSLLVSWVFDLVMALDIIIKFNTSFTDEHSIKVFDRSRIRSRYLQRSFVLDFLAIIPLDFFVAKYDASDGSVVAWLRIIKVLHAPKLYRQMSLQSRERSSSIARLIADIQFLYCVSLAVVHILACVWYYMTARHESFDNINGYNLIGEPTGGNDGGGPFAIRYYMYCAGIVVYVIAANGMPFNITGAPEEVWFLNLANILNLSFWAYLMGSISGLFISMDEKIAESHEHMSSCVRFIKHNNIPLDLAHELKSFFSLDANQKSSLTLAEQNRVYRNLPQSIQVQLAGHTSRDLLLQVDIFRNTSDYFLDAVSTLLQVDIVAGGEFLYQVGAVCRSLLIIASGVVETVKSEPGTQLWTVQEVHEAGEALGQLEFCLDTRYLSTARVAAGRDVLRAFRLQKEDYIRVLKLYPKDEDIIHQNVASLSEDEKHDTASTVRSAYSGTSVGSLESNLRSIMMDDSHLDRAMADIDKAKLRSQEQRIRSFCNAALHGNLDALTRLSNSGVDVNGRDANGRTALMLATCAGHIEILKYLIFKAANPNLKDKFGGSALLDAIKGNHTEVMAFLKDQGAVLELDDAAGTLCSLAAEGKTDHLRLLLSLGADPNVADYDKRTPLHLAASEGHLDCVKLLLSKWAKVNPLDRMKGTPLTDSVRHGHIEVQQYLRSKGGRLIIDPVELGTTLCEAAASGNIQKIQILYENGADINQGDYDGRTALHLAACCNKLSVIEYLVNIPGINMNPLDRCCCTPYDDALRENQQAIASILQLMGGLRGQDPQLEEARRRHLEEREAAAKQKVKRREERMALFKTQTGTMDSIMEIYRTMSERLPTLFKLMNVLCVTLRSRRNISVVDRTPHPTLQEVRTYFYTSFSQYLDRRYIKKFENFLTLCEEYGRATHIQDQAMIVEKLIHDYLDSNARGFIQVDPDLVERCQERLKEGRGEGVVAPDLLDELDSYIRQQLEEVLPAYFVSKEFYLACRKHNGFLWRVTKLSRLAYENSRLLLEKGIRPLLRMRDTGELDCVPHISPHSRAHFRIVCEQLEKHLVSLNRNLHIIAYLSKDVCLRETIREGHASQAIQKGSAQAGAIVNRKNF